MGDDVEEIASRKEGRPSHRLHHTGHDDFDIPESVEHFSATGRKLCSHREGDGASHSRPDDASLKTMLS
jgi:hypothetical protein